MGSPLAPKPYLPKCAAPNQLPLSASVEAANRAGLGVGRGLLDIAATMVSLSRGYRSTYIKLGGFTACKAPERLAESCPLQKRVIRYITICCVLCPGKTLVTLLSSTGLARLSALKAHGLCD